MTIDSRCHRPSQLSVKVLLVLHQYNCVLFLLRELIQVLFLLLLISCVGLLESKSRIAGEARACKEDQLEAEVSDTGTMEASEAIHRATNLVIPHHSIVINISGLHALSRLHQLDNIGHRDQHTREDGAVTRFCLVHSVTSENDID